jgi:sugar lactone lactonase YvrE
MKSKHGCLLLAALLLLALGGCASKPKPQVSVGPPEAVPSTTSRQNGRSAALASASIIRSVAGDGARGYTGDGGEATLASLDDPEGLAVGSSNAIYIADTGNNCIRKVGASGMIATVAGTGEEGYLGDGEAAVSAKLSAPRGVAADAAGRIYIADTGNNCIRKVGADGIIRTVAGTGEEGYLGDGGAAVSGKLSAPGGVAVDSSGNIYVADTGNHCIRKIDARGTITTISGDGTPSYSGDGGAATRAELCAPRGVAVDPSGRIYIADTGNNCIRMVDRSGIITTIAGIGIPLFSGEGRAAISAYLDGPDGIAVDSSGDIFVSDTLNQRVRKIGADGIIETVVGTGEQGDAGDGFPSASAELHDPCGIAVDAFGNLFIADSRNDRVRKAGQGRG